MFKIISAVAVATTVQTASAGNRKTLKFKGQTYLQVTNETTWPNFPTIKVKNEDYGEPAYDGAWVYIDGVWTSTGGVGGDPMRCDKDNVPNTSGNHDCTQPKFIKEDVDLEGATGPQFDAGICTSTTGFDYVGEALLQDPESEEINSENAESDEPTVEGNDYMIVNMYGAGNNYCRYLCQETDRCMFYTIGNGRCYLKGAGAKKKAGKKNAKKEGGSCIPDPDSPDSTEPPTDPAEDPCNEILCGKQCKGRLFTYHNPFFGKRSSMSNTRVAHDCGWNRGLDKCVTGSHTGPNEKTLGKCTKAPTAAPTAAPAAPVTQAPELATPAPRNCRKQCAGKFDKVWRAKGKKSLAQVCGLKNCNQCVECTRPPMVNFTLYQGSGDDSNCPSGCKDEESEADVYGNTTWSCLESYLDMYGDEKKRNCVPTHYPDQFSTPSISYPDLGCPVGCYASQPQSVAGQSPQFDGPVVCVTDEDASLCTGPVEPERGCFPTPYSFNGFKRFSGNLDFTTKVIKTIKKKGFWETHCQLECFNRKNCGAYVYTKGTCKLFRTLPITEATGVQFADFWDRYVANGYTDPAKKAGTGGVHAWSWRTPGVKDVSLFVTSDKEDVSSRNENLTPQEDRDIGDGIFRASGMCGNEDILFSVPPLWSLPPS